MLTIFTDAAFDRFSGFGTYCIVVIADKGFKDWSVDDIDGCTNSTQAEYAGLVAAYEIVAKAGVPAIIYCDNMSAIDTICNDIKYRKRAELPGLVVKHFKGHQVGTGVVIDDDVKSHHWADVQARGELCRRLDERKTVAYNSKVKET